MTPDEILYAVPQSPRHSPYPKRQQMHAAAGPLAELCLKWHFQTWSAAFGLRNGLCDGHRMLRWQFSNDSPHAGIPVAEAKNMKPRGRAWHQHVPNYMRPACKQRNASDDENLLLFPKEGHDAFLVLGSRLARLCWRLFDCS